VARSVGLLHNKAQVTDHCLLSETCSRTLLTMSSVLQKLYEMKMQQKLL